MSVLPPPHPRRPHPRRPHPSPRGPGPCAFPCANRGASGSTCGPSGPAVQCRRRSVLFAPLRNRVVAKQLTHPFAPTAYLLAPTVLAQLAVSPRTYARLVESQLQLSGYTGDVDGGQSAATTEKPVGERSLPDTGSAAEPSPTYVLAVAVSDHVALQVAPWLGDGALHWRRLALTVPDVDAGSARLLRRRCFSSWV